MEREIHAVSSFCVCLKMSLKNLSKNLYDFVKKCHIKSEGKFWDMNRDEEIRLLHERLDYYMMEADDDKFDSEEVIKLLKRLNKLEPQTDTKLEAEEALRDFWEYVEGREWEEQIISGNDHKNGNL